MKMKKIGLIFLLGIVALMIATIFFAEKNRSLKNFFDISDKKNATQSGFASSIAQAEKKAQEAKKVQEEKRLQEEKTKAFLAVNGPCKRIPILMYHHVDQNGNWLYVSPEVFRQQMDYLLAKGYTAVGLPEIVAGLQSGQPLPAKPVVITFDDGYRDIFNQAWPILRERGLKATVFVITQLMYGDQYLTWEQAREMAGGGIFTIGDHTLDHRSLSGMSEADLRNEIFNSKRIIEENLGQTINVFAYPFGNTNNLAVNILKEAGFVAGVTSGSGIACAKLPFVLPRIRVGNTSLASYGL